MLSFRQLPLTANMNIYGRKAQHQTLQSSNMRSRQKQKYRKIRYKNPGYYFFERSPDRVIISGEFLIRGVFYSLEHATTPKIFKNLPDHRQ